MPIGQKIWLIFPSNSIFLSSGSCSHRSGRIEPRDGQTIEFRLRVPLILFHLHMVLFIAPHSADTRSDRPMYLLPIIPKLHQIHFPASSDEFDAFNRMLRNRTVLYHMNVDRQYDFGSKVDKPRSEEHTSELQSLISNSYAV